MTEYYIVIQERDYGKWNDKHVFVSSWRQLPYDLKGFNKVHREYLRRTRQSRNTTRPWRVVFRKVNDNEE